ncbi:membrane protein [Mycolicibacterium chitae]|uniref:Putative Mce associated membrane protein n=1 Tax=Mycolicibacterium chitae TaxID=1792 RepID=A0A3S4RGZ2_MYCCI|nr:hypothetical protein [Mycolicibacterium chitae]MCV7104382.1 hypothetical protein [Mycolicibacterium chitae]BBZ01361.1 membrane protein [Mycolicibacterium chitae]VEG50198.1 putative Mce associated membrane protein [Mycolicibacterium chitae]
MEGDAGSGRLTPPEDEGASITDDEVGSEGSEDDDALPEASDPIASTDADAAPGQRSRLYSRGWVIGVAATLLVLALVLAGVGVLARLADDDMQTRNANEAAAVQAAKDCVIATQAPDLATMEASQRKIIECGTGDFGAQAVLYSGVLVDAYQAAQAQVQVSNIRAAAERHNDDGTVDVLVALRVKVSNSTVQDQETGYRLRVQMAPEGGTYKIAQLDQVTR